MANQESSSSLSPGSFKVATQIQQLQKQVEQMRIEHARKIAKQHLDDRGRHQRGHKESRCDDRLEGVKISSFIGKNDPEAYLKWEHKIEKIFDCSTYDERKKLKMAVQGFKEYALVWWIQKEEERRKIGKKPIDRWEDMKRVMRRRYAPHDIVNISPSSCRKDISKKEGVPSSNKPKAIQQKVEPTKFSKELTRILSLKDNIIKREREHERSETLEREILESETLMRKEELSEKQRECEVNTLSANTLSENTLSVNTLRANTLSESKNEELCLNSDFPNESLVHIGVCLDLQEISEDTSHFVQSMEDETIESIHDALGNSQPCLESTLQKNINMDCVASNDLLNHVDCDNVESVCLKDRLGFDLPLHDNDKHLTHWQQNQKHASSSNMQPVVNCLDRNCNYFVVSATPFGNTNLEPNENIFLSHALYSFRVNLLHNIGSYHASLHYFRNHSLHRLIWLCKFCDNFLRLHVWPNNDLTKVSEWPNQVVGLKDDCVRLVFDPGGDGLNKAVEE